mmetsp:Transcript_45387/g.84667  ORF Transcript_45387/g.84667 Transcript_45387/m.84667 type:complete len:194 (+) Transcript_45387:135-716(+)
MIQVLVIAVSGKGKEHRWVGSHAKPVPLRSLVEKWAREHRVPESAVALEKDGTELDLSKSPADYAWQAEQVELYCWPTENEYMEPEDTKKRRHPVASSQVKMKSPETKKPRGEPKAKAATVRSAPPKTGSIGGVPDLEEPIEFLQDNPKKAGGAPFERYEKYKVAKTIKEALSLGAAKGDIQFDWQRGWFKRT